MQFHLFTKPFSGLTLPETVALASRLGVDGLDLCVREGHPVAPGNVETALPQAVETAAAHNLFIGLVSAPPGFTDPDAPLAQALCQAMSRSGLKLLKIGYFPFQPEKHDYKTSLSDARRKLSRWAQLAQDHNFTVCYHTHANQLGSSAGTLAAMLQDISPARLWAYLDPAQLLIQGEGFPAALSILQGRIAAVGLKDVLLSRRPSGPNGSIASQWVHPGTGMVDFTRCAQALRQARLTPILSAHVLMHDVSGDRLQTAADELSFYRQIFQEPTP